MGTRRFALERGGPKQLRLRWRRGFRDLEVSLSGTRFGVDPLALPIGATLALPDGSTLLLRTERRRWWSIAFRDELLVERDGVPVPGSDGDPRVIGRRAATLMLLFGLLRLIVVGGLGLTRPGVLEGDPLLLVSFGYGLLLVVLGVLAALGWRLPLALAAGVLVVETVGSFLLGGVPRVFALVIQGAVIAHLVRAWRRTKPRPSPAALAAVFE